LVNKKEYLKYAYWNTVDWLDWIGRKWTLLKTLTMFFLKPDLQQTFILNLRRLRNERGLSQEELCKQIKVSRKYIGSIELGYKFPSKAVIEKIAEVLEVAPYQLFLPSFGDKKVSPVEAINAYNDFLIERYGEDLRKARDEFLEKMSKGDEKKKGKKYPENKEG